MELNILLAVLFQLFLTMSHVHSFATFRLCGKTLVETMSFVCGERGYYSGPTDLRKRSITSLTDSRPFRTEADAKSFLGHSREKRRTGRIAHECCDNLCSWDIIESYCNPLPDDSSPSRIDEIIGRSPHLSRDKSADTTTNNQDDQSVTNGDNVVSDPNDEAVITADNGERSDADGNEEREIIVTARPRKSGNGDRRDPSSVKTAVENTTTTRPSSTTTKTSNDENNSQRIGGKSNRRRNKGSREGRRSSRRRNKRKRPRRAGSEENVAAERFQPDQRAMDEMTHLAKLLTTIEALHDSDHQISPSSKIKKVPSISPLQRRPDGDDNDSRRDRGLFFQRNPLDAKSVRIPAIRVPPEWENNDVKRYEVELISDDVNKFTSLPERTIEERTIRTLSLLLNRDKEAFKLRDLLQRHLSITESEDGWESESSVFFSESEPVSQVPR